MLSALIPIYNFDVRPFVSELQQQFERTEVDYEIILADDASGANYRALNSELQTLKNVKYIQLSENIGRAGIRNFLADQAVYNYLFFFDCDSEIPSDTFVKNYIQYVKNNSIICGGRSYRNVKPVEQELILRWQYGVKRETSNAETRNKYPMRSFMTNNYLISKEVHNHIKFDEQIMNYGHEDTLFGIELKRAGYTVLHIDNPLIHIGLEPAEAFIVKTKQGIENLIYLNRNYNYPELEQDIKLLRIYHEYSFLRPIFGLTYRLFSKMIVKNLKGNHPSLFLFDVFKIIYLIHFQKSQNYSGATETQIQ
jgi:cellulose synthase/poly-beta-1,6-N-acetylglucosamine synthase-like glycosyltransferase